MERSECARERTHVRRSVPWIRGLKNSNKSLVSVLTSLRIALQSMCWKITANKVLHFESACTRLFWEAAVMTLGRRAVQFRNSAGPSFVSVTEGQR